MKLKIFFIDRFEIVCWLFLMISILPVCNYYPSNSQTELAKSDTIFRKDTINEIFELDYEDKHLDMPRIYGPHRYRNLSYEDFLRTVYKRDTIILRLRSKFINDTISVFYNTNLVYFSDTLNTDGSIAYADGAFIRKGNKAENYIGIKLNDKKIIWFYVDREYLFVEVFYHENKLCVVFNNAYLVLS